MGNYRRVVLWFVLLALAAAVEGCQRGPTWDLAQVEGTVTKNGRPLRGIEVIFVADSDSGTVGPRTLGRTDEAGHYRLRADSGGDGAVVGKHRVLFFDAETASKRRRGGTPGMPLMKEEKMPERKKAEDAPRVSPRYGRFDETPVRAEVHPGPQTLDFDIP
jgi:hypothetical protein